MKICIIGAGASGMMAALAASERKTNIVTVFERQQRAGKKLSVTGNGRCNLTNTNASVTYYHGQSPEFAAFALSSFGPEEVRAYFKKLGLLTTEEYGGRVYPLSNSANSVLDVLRLRAVSCGIDIKTSCEAEIITKTAEGFKVTAGAETETFDRVIVACGGPAGRKAGGTESGIKLLKSLGHSCTALCPSLVQIKTDPVYPRALKGIKADCRISLFSCSEKRAETEGELLFTDSGVSGPAVFDISRQVSVGSGDDLYLMLDFLKDSSAEEVTEMIRQRIELMPELPCSDLLTGTVHNRLGRMVLKYSAIAQEKKISELSSSDVKKIAYSIKNFTLKVAGTESFDNAQVTAGGIRTSEFDTETMESRIVPGLYACGEVLDIDGDCGGFNLQWAWASGRLAGLSASAGK